MILKEWLRFIYGMAMGTSVPYIKPTNRFMWPTTFKKVDEQFSLFLGGSCACGIIHDADNLLLINSNSGKAAVQLQQSIGQDSKSQKLRILNTSFRQDFLNGNQLHSNVEKFFVPNLNESKLLKEWPNKPETLEKICEERTFEIAGENVMVIPVSESASQSDLVVFFKKRRVLFLGALFYNRIHPVLHPHDGMNVQNWIRNLEALLLRFQPLQIVPAEGEIAEPQALTEFISYLKSLSDPKVEFSDCRKNFDWIEIPGQTSLEENFDLLRENIKSFTKF